MSDQEMSDQEMSDHETSALVTTDRDNAESPMDVVTTSALATTDRDMGESPMDVVNFQRIYAGPFRDIAEPCMVVFNELMRYVKSLGRISRQGAGGILVGTMFLGAARMMVELERNALIEGLLVQAQTRGDTYAGGLSALRGGSVHVDGSGDLPQICSDAVCHYRAAELIHLYKSCLEPEPACGLSARSCGKAVVCRDTPVLVTYLIGLIDECPCVTCKPSAKQGPTMPEERMSKAGAEQ